ncbi:hypothetical protein [Paenibacillus tyrfis]|uniref:hypothetical protein n=1 Tax=Paenibacillus tyrfis TaxID=1501230 RepID=UPI00209E87FA|nr:hypothetical protein [Paenibacillus tyrfis]MCP1311124.1 hypothetical protein [Paenibacillus tyrfis]
MAYTGKTDWKYDEVVTENDMNRIEKGVMNAHAELQGVKDTLDQHIDNYTVHVPYAVATGAANTYAATLNPAPSSYYEGMAVSVKISTTNTGASAININGLGAVPIKKTNGNDVLANNLRGDSIYTLRYNGSNFILQGEGGGGSATTENVLFGKTFTNDDGEQTGTMPNNGQLNYTPGPNLIQIPAGYISGGTIAASVPKLVDYTYYKPKGIRTIDGNSLTYKYTIPIELPPEQGIPAAIWISKIGIDLPTEYANPKHRLYVNSNIWMHRYSDTQYWGAGTAVQEWDSNNKILYSVDVNAFASNGITKGSPIELTVSCDCQAGSMGAANPDDPFSYIEFIVRYATV